MNHAQANPLSRTAWLMLAVLWPVALLNYMDRQMMAAMKSSIMLSIPTMRSEADWGILPAFFKWTYALLSPVGGYIADRFSRRHVIAGSLFVWSAVTWATGHCTTFGELKLTRALMGVSEAFYIPAALALITDYHAGPTRSRAVGIHQMAIYVGVILGGFSGWLAGDVKAPDYNADRWRMVFDGCGLFGVVYAIPLFLVLRNPPLMYVPGTPRIPPRQAVSELMRNAGFLLLVICFTLPALPAWIIKDWMPAILERKFSISQGKAGVSATLFVNLACIAGAVGGGWLADHWVKRSVRGRIRVSATGLALLVPALFGVGNAPTLTIVILFLVLFGIGWGFFDCNNMPILRQITRPELCATGYGFMNLVSISCGGFADWGFGILRDHHVPLNVIFGVFAGVALLAVFLILRIRPRGAG